MARGGFWQKKAMRVPEVDGVPTEPGLGESDVHAATAAN